MATVFTRTTAGAGSTTVPAGATSAQIECTGGGGGGYGGGGSGGAYARTNALAVAAGNTLFYSLSSIPAGNNPEANPTDTWVRLTTNAAPTTTAQGCLAKSGVQAHPTDFTGRAGGTAAASIGDVKFNGGAAGNSDGSTKGGGGGGGAGSTGAGGNAVDAGSNHTGGAGGAGGGGAGGHGDEGGTLLQNGFAPGGGGGGNWLGSDANGAVGKIVITFNDTGAGLTNLSVKDAGTWKTATPYAKDAGTWKAATEVHVKDAGVWKKVFG
jgi:hypothetical protein